MIDQRLRRLAIGGSDIAALFNADDFKDEFAVWAEKKGGLEESDAPPDMHMLMGKLFEQPILELYSRMTEREVAYRNETIQHPTRPFQVYSPDALVVGQRRGVEMKVVFWDQRAKWGWESDEMPDRVLFQCWWYMSAMDYPQWDVAALLGEGLPRIYTVDRLDAVAEKAMLDRAEEWWKRYLVGDGRPPIDGSDESRRWLQKTYPAHKHPDMRDATAQEAEWLEQYVVTRLAQRQLKEQSNLLESLIKDAIKDREGLNWGDFRHAFTWRKTRDTAYTDWKSMAIALLHNFVKDAGQRGALEAQYARAKLGTRRIHINHPMLNRARRGVEQESEEVTV